MQASQPTKVAGNIHQEKYHAFWKSLKPDAYVLSILEHGYRIPFRDGLVPAAYREPNNKSALDNMPYLQEHVETLLVDATVDEVFSQPLCCSPLTVASRYVDGLLRLRMCIDLSRYINLLLKKEAVTLPSLDKAIKMFLPGDFQATFDLKSAFHHVLIHPDHRQYLGFSIPSKSGRQILRLPRAPLRLSHGRSAPGPHDEAYLHLPCTRRYSDLHIHRRWLDPGLP